MVLDQIGAARREVREHGVDRHRVEEGRVTGDADDDLGLEGCRGRAEALEDVVRVASKAANLELAGELLHRIVGGIGGGRHDHRANALAGRDSLDQPSQDRRSAEIGEHLAREPPRTHPCLHDHRRQRG